MQTVTSHGAEIPVLGIGTYPMRSDACVAAVSAALQMGYRHVDTAQDYRNETEVGEGIAASGVPRDEIFLTTKVRPQWTSAREMPGSVEDSLKRLKVDRVDLLLAHWPNPAVPIAETVKALSEMKRRGLTRHIGVSNYTVAMMEEAVKVSPEPIVTNQIEYHPLLDQSRLVPALRRLGVAITAYSPIARGRVSTNATIAAIASAHGRTAIQVALRWLIQQGDVIAIPKSSKADRLKEFLGALDFALTDDEMARIGTLGTRNGRLINEPSLVPAWD